MKALHLYSSRLIDFCLSKKIFKKKPCLHGRLSKAAFPEPSRTAVWIWLAQYRLEAMRCVDCILLQGLSKLATRAGIQLACYAALQLLVTKERKMPNKQPKKIQLISAAEVPEAERFCALQKRTAVNNLLFGGWWMKSSASESICVAKAVKYKRGKFYNSLNKSSREKENCSTQISLLSVNRAKINQAAEQTNMQRADSPFLSARCLQFFSNFNSN